MRRTTPTRANGHWACVVRGEPTIDVAAFGEPVLAINEDSKEDVSRYMRIMEGAREGALPEMH